MATTLRLPQTIAQYTDGSRLQSVWAGDYEPLRAYLGVRSFVSYLGSIGGLRWKNEVIAQGKIEATQLKTHILAFFALAILITIAQITIIHYIKNGKLPNSAYTISNLAGAGFALVGMGFFIAKIYRIFSRAIDKMEASVDAAFADKIINAYERATDNHNPLPAEHRNLAQRLVVAISVHTHPVVLANPLAEYKYLRSTLRKVLIITSLAFIIGMSIGLALHYKYIFNKAFSIKTVFINAIVGAAISCLLLFLMTWKALPWIRRQEREAQALIDAPLPVPVSKQNYPAGGVAAT